MNFPETLGSDSIFAVDICVGNEDCASERASVPRDAYVAVHRQGE